jgi:glycosyltransferase involved in cell wall biosynthesis
MAMGRAIVSYDLTESRVSAADAALYAEPGNVDEFAGRIDTLLSDAELRARMGAAGRERVERELAWQHSEPALLAAYERALQARTTRSAGIEAVPAPTRP